MNSEKSNAFSGGVVENLEALFFGVVVGVELDVKAVAVRHDAGRDIRATVLAHQRSRGIATIAAWF